MLPKIFQDITHIRKKPHSENHISGAPGSHLDKVLSPFYKIKTNPFSYLPP